MNRGDLAVLACLAIVFVGGMLFALTHDPLSVVLILMGGCGVMALV